MRDEIIFKRLHQMQKVVEHVADHIALVGKDDTRRALLVLHLETVRQSFTACGANDDEVSRVLARLLDISFHLDWDDAMEADIVERVREAL